MDKKFFILSVIILGGVIFLLLYFSLTFLDFRKTAEGSESNPPKIIWAKIFPEKVIPGQVMTISAEVESQDGIREVIAKIGEIETLSLLLKEGTIYKGVWEGNWKVHSVKENEEYSVIVIAKSLSGKNTAVNLFLKDPSQVKSCGCYTPGCYCDIIFSNFITEGYELTSASIKVEVKGDLDLASEYITVYADGMKLGDCCIGNCNQCSSSYATCATYDVSRDASDNYLSVRCDASPDVNSCSTYCQVTLSWSEERVCVPNGSSCNKDIDCCSNNCVQDYDGVGKFCCNFGESAHDGLCYPGMEFSLSISPQQIKVPKPNAGSVDVSTIITADLTGGPAGMVYFGVSNLPPGVSAKIPDPCQPSCSRSINFKIDSSAQPGNYQIQIDGDFWYSQPKQYIRGINAKYTAIAMSANGQYQTAVSDDGRIYRSDDYGKTWKDTAPGSYHWENVAMSSDGKYQTAVVWNGRIYVSNDYGQTWSARGIQAHWQDISMSSDGRYQTAVDADGRIYTSSNYGETWTARGPTDVGGWLSVAVSGNGRYQTAIAWKDSMNMSPRLVYRSSDYGTTWTKVSGLSLDPSIGLWPDTALSEDGKYQTIIAGHIYTSGDYGLTWTENDQILCGMNAVVGSTDGVDMTPDGKIQVCVGVDTGAGVYISKDYGKNWHMLAETNAVAIAISADGSRISALTNFLLSTGEDAGYIYPGVSNLKSVSFNLIIFSPCKSHNVWGYAWSENIGWISFACQDTMTPGEDGPDYGVDIDDNPSSPTFGQFSGYAWSENIGWISFNQSDLTGCPQPPCKAWVDISSGKVLGWAKALSANDPNSGGWEGWIHLNGTIYQVNIDPTTSPSQFKGWGWGGEVVGWISFNCNNPETGNVCTQSNYKVYTTFSFSAPPTANEMSFDAEYCEVAPGEGLIAFKWKYFDPNGNKETKYIFQVDDNSNFSSPEVNRTAEGLSNPSGTVNVQLVEVLTSAQPDKIVFNRRYYWRVKVFNEKGRESNWIYGDSFQTPVHPWPWPQFTHSPQTPMVGQPTTFDGTSSSVFGGATIVSWQWQIEDANPPTLPNQPVVQVQFTSLGQKEVILTIRDSDGFSCSKRDFIRVGLPLPTPPHEY